MTTPLGDVFTSDNLNAAGAVPSATQALSTTKHDGKCLEPQLVDKVVAQKRLDQAAAAMNLEVGSILRLERPNGCNGIALQQHRVFPREPHRATRGDVLIARSMPGASP
jgi:hypothetical protein